MMRHLGLFENFDRVNEMTDGELERLVLADVKELSNEDLEKLMAIPAEKKNEVKLANGWKWYLGQEGSERFRFLARDEDDAKDAAAMWGAKLVGELDEDEGLEFEDTPMDESNKTALLEAEIEAWKDWSLYRSMPASRAANKQFQKVAQKFVDEIYKKKAYQSREKMVKAIEEYFKAMGELAKKHVKLGALDTEVRNAIFFFAQKAAEGAWDDWDWGELDNQLDKYYDEYI